MKKRKDPTGKTCCSMNKKCSFVAIVGEPNAGKSTLVNDIVGEKISIVSSKVQTTRRPIRGIVELDAAQIVFIDTPGFCKANSHLEKALIQNFRHSYKDADVIILVIDATSRNHDGSISFIEKFQESDKTFAVAINKTDIAKKEQLLELADCLSKYEFIKEIFMISALKDDGVGAIKEFLKMTAPEGPWLYEEDQVTDLPMNLRLAEITREKIFKMLEKELPYSIYVETEIFREAEKKARISQVIVVMKDSQKAIVLGRGGQMIKMIKEAAIADMADLFGKKIELKLFVKVKEKWTEKKAHLQNAGIID